MSKKSRMKIFGIGVLGILTAILFSVMGFSFYQIMNKGAGSLLGNFGVNNFYYQNVVIIIIAVIILVIMGISSRKIVKQIFDL